MSRICALTSRFFGCLAVALVGVCMLAVPDRLAFADTGDQTICEGLEPGTPEYEECARGACLGHSYCNTNCTFVSHLLCSGSCNTSRLGCRACACIPVVEGGIETCKCKKP